MTGHLRATAVPGGVTHYWRVGPRRGFDAMGPILGTLCGLQRPPRILPWAAGAWPRDCKRCVRSQNAKPKGE
jgi:hypothetical protein